MATGLSSQLLDSLNPGRTVVVLFILTLASFIIDFTWKPRYTKSLPRVAFGDSFLGTIKNWFFYATRYNTWVAEGYEKHPDRVLSTKEAHHDTLYSTYQFLGVDDQFPIQTIHKHLARNLVSLIPGVQEEARPVLEQRLADMVRKGEGYEPPEDMVTWLIRQAEAEGREDGLTAELLSKSILPVQFAAIHTTVMTGFNLFLDLLSSDPSMGYLDAICEETARVFAEEGGTWTKQGLSRLHRTDSAIKESMRLSHFATSLTHRKVVVPEGVTNATEGWHAPYGAYMMLDLVGTHRDPEVYPDPDRYDAWRFEREREAFEEKVKTGERVSVEEGHGRHACPGRFFVAHELKMILAYLVQNYEIKPLAEKPRGPWFGGNMIPPVDTRIEVRRRKGTV
ncbi:hypothetical protein N0V88_005337 [Collariella sp. IMI 366227]|nr:hypothetical protein N0V88_005337 [Collariella sp. IMI 366227]